MNAAIEGLGITGTLSEVQVLGGQHSLGGYVVGIHALPAAGQRTSVEDDLYAEIVGIGQDILIELHHGLLVASEEVDLDAQDAVLLHPRHLLATCCRLVHLASRTLRSIVPVAIAVIPQEEAYTL